MESDNGSLNDAGGNEFAPHARKRKDISLLLPVKRIANRPQLERTPVKNLSSDALVLIFGFLTPIDIIRARVCKIWRDAAKQTIVPLCDFEVKSVRSYNLMRVMVNTLPHLQQLSISDLDDDSKYFDGEDPEEEEEEEEESIEAINHTAHYDIEIISNFRKLQVLEISSADSLNGRYPFFNFPLLQKLKITDCYCLKWDLMMLSELPLLKELRCIQSPVDDELYPTGDLSNLRVLKDTLEDLYLLGCEEIRGNFMQLADFPNLKGLYLLGCGGISGDIREIRGSDFPSIESLHLPSSVIGGTGYKFQRILDLNDFMDAIYPLLKRTPDLFDHHKLKHKYRYSYDWSLSTESTDWYYWGTILDKECPRPPLHLKLIQAGSRVGWSWLGNNSQFCEINWLDPEPRSDSEDYEAYIEELKDIERRIDFYRGYYQPPTEQEYHRICEEHRARTSEQR